MYIVDNIDNFNINHMYVSDKQDNTVIDGGKFSKIMYSTQDITLNGIFILCSFNSTSVEKNTYNKFKVSWNKDKNKELVEKLKQLESSILDRYGNACYSSSLSNLLDYNNIRIFSEENALVSNTDFLLRISGLWENEKGSGITYKFLEINHL